MATVDPVMADENLQLILDLAREAYWRQHDRLESYRTRAGSLLAFAAVLVAVSVDATVPARDSWSAAGIIFVVLSATLFLLVFVGFHLEYTPDVRSLADSYLVEDCTLTQLQVLGNTVEAVGLNGRAVQRVELVYSVALVGLTLGTLIIGVRAALLLL